MNYQKYIASKEWARKRKERIALDGNRCRLCDEDGSRYGLEVHHRPDSYQRIPNESVENDLITVCSRCHDLITSSIREDRYGRRELPPFNPINIQIREVSHGMARNEIQIEFIGCADSAQRPNGRSVESLVKIDETDYVKEKQNRGR